MEFDFWVQLQVAFWICSFSKAKKINILCFLFFYISSLLFFFFFSRCVANIFSVINFVEYQLTYKIFKYFILVFHLIENEKKIVLSCFISEKKKIIIMKFLILISLIIVVAQVSAQQSTVTIYSSPTCNTSTLQSSTQIITGSASCSQVPGGPTYFKTICNKTSGEVTSQVFWSKDCEDYSLLTEFSATIDAACIKQTNWSGLKIFCGENSSGVVLHFAVLMMLVVLSFAV